MRSLPTTIWVERAGRCQIEDRLREVEEPFTQDPKVLAYLRVGAGLPEDDRPQDDRFVLPETEVPGQPEQGARNVATTYNTERYRPIYANKRGLPVFLNRAS